MREAFGNRRKQLMRHLLRNKAGATIDDLAAELGVTRTAIRQHLGSLQRAGLVRAGEAQRTRGRPKRLFVLSDAGREAFPRHYSWFARLLVEAMTREHGTAGLKVRLGRIAAAVVAQIRAEQPSVTSQRKNIGQIAAVMDQLGYDARQAPDLGGAPVVEADNCVFHELAMKHPQICHFDLALLSGYTGAKVDLHECMARGGHVCRFRFTPRS